MAEAALRTAIFPHSISIGLAPAAVPAASFKSLYRKCRNTTRSCTRLASSHFRYSTRTNRE
jgi:hypothetical protein